MRDASLLMNFNKEEESHLPSLAVATASRGGTEPVSGAPEDNHLWKVLEFNAYNNGIMF